MSERATYWREIIERQLRSGDSVAEFCADEGIAAASFYVWRKRLREGQGERRGDVRDDRPRLVPVTVAASDACLEVVLPTGIVVRVPEGTLLRTLRDVLAALDLASVRRSKRYRRSA